MNGTEWALIIVALITAVIAPLVLGRVNAVAAERLVRQGWARTDAVAAQAAEAAKLLHDAQQETIKRTDEVARIAAEADKDIQGRLVAISKMVDGELTAARQAELDQTRVTLVLLKRVILLDEARGLPVNQSDADQLAIRENRVDDLENTIAERRATEALEETAALHQPPV